MFDLGRRKSDTSYGVVIDVGSGSVGVAVIATDAGAKIPRTIFSHRVYMRNSRRGLSETGLMRQLRETLFSACLLLSKDGLAAMKSENKRASIDRISLCCSAPWGYTIARNVQYTSDTPFKVDEVMINDLTESAEREVEEALEQNNTINVSDFTVVERATVDIRINDYEIKNPLGLKGTEIELSHVTGLLPQEILSAVYEVQDKLFPDTNLTAHTFMLIMYCVIRDLFPRNDSLLIVDVTGEATEFGLVEHGLLIENTQCSYGSNTLIRGVMRATKSTEVDTVSLLQSFNDKTLGKESRAVINTEFNRYSLALKDTIDHMLTKRILPQTVVVIAHKPLDYVMRSFVLETLENNTGQQLHSLAFSEQMNPFLTSSGISDVYLAVAARFFHKMHGCAETTG